MSRSDRPAARRERARRSLLRAAAALERLLFALAVGSAAGAVVWLVRHYG